MNYKSPRMLLSRLSLTIRSIQRKYSDFVLMKRVGSITCIGLNRTEKKNCFNVELIQTLQEAINTFEKDENSPVAVLYGEKGNFSSGYDLKEYEDYPRLIEDVISTGFFEKCASKVVIAAVSGFALGPGFDLALWCDFRIVEETAVLGGYAKQFGIPLTDSSAQRLVSMLGINKALDIALSGRIVKPNEALDCGIATRLVACGTSLGQAVSYANSIANMPSSCLTADRANLLSMSSKYTDTVCASLRKMKSHYQPLAIQEVRGKSHLTKSGDVRHKDSS